MDRVSFGNNRVKPPVPLPITRPAGSDFSSGSDSLTASDPPTGSDSSNITCFNNDGSSSLDIFCDLEGKDTCCGAGWDCLANGLCRKSGTTSYAQGTCLNKAFDRCLSFCNQRMLLSGHFRSFVGFVTELSSSIPGIHRSEQLWTTGNQ